jgi:Sulfotransferase domain
MRLPDFIVAGVRKCGTTWLHQCLSEHPGIFMPGATKELYYFDKYWGRGAGWYARYYRDASPQSKCGDASPTYFASPTAPERIKEILPDAKLVFMFRDPVERVVSLHNHMLAKGDIALPLGEALDAHPELLEEGFYARHFARFRAIFPQQAMLAMILDDIDAAGEDGLVPLFRFLGVDEGFRPPSLHARAYERREARSHLAARTATATARLLHRNNLHGVVAWAKAAGAERLVLRHVPPPFDPVPPQIVARLRALYADEVKRLGDFLGRDLQQVWTADRMLRDAEML